MDILGYYMTSVVVTKQRKFFYFSCMDQKTHKNYNSVITIGRTLSITMVRGNKKVECCSLAQGSTKSYI